MLNTPNVFDMKAKGVGMQTWNVLLNRRRKSLVGVQWSGSAGWNEDVLSHDMVVLYVDVGGVINTRRDDMVVPRDVCLAVGCLQVCINQKVIA